MNIALVNDSPQIKPRDPFEIKSDLLWSIDIQNKSTEDINEKRQGIYSVLLFISFLRDLTDTASHMFWSLDCLAVAVFSQQVYLKELWKQCIVLPPKSLELW